DEMLENVFVRLRAAGGIGIPADSTRTGKHLMQRLFDVLRSRAKKFDARRPALRANRRLRLLKAAAVAAQRLPLTVMCQRRVAARAGGDITTIATEHIGRLPAPVDEQNRLLAALQCAVQRR